MDASTATQDTGWFSWIVAGLVGIATLIIIKIWSTRRHNSGGGPTKFHVLIPCHIESVRRQLLFMRCLTSVSLQYCDSRISGYEVFISISGPPEYRDNALKIVAKMRATSMSSAPGKIVWHVYDTKKKALPQMEHLRSLVEKSGISDPKAKLLFLDNDDMFHPMRLMAFQEALGNLPLPPETPLPLSCKLLLDENMGPYEGSLHDLCSPNDFFLWKKDPSLRRKIQWVPTSRCDDMDATEYVDFMVPTSVMEKFFRLTPRSITSHRFCDLRLLAILERLCPIEVGDLPQYPWLYAHYKTSMDAKWRNFDTHGAGIVLGSHSLDQASMGRMKPSAKDVALSKHFKSKLSPGQIAMCRGHLESIVIQYIGWDASMLEEAKKDKIQELNQYHGPGLADDLWEEVIEDMTSLFKGNELDMNQTAWNSMLD